MVLQWRGNKKIGKVRKRLVKHGLIKIGKKMKGNGDEIPKKA